MPARSVIRDMAKALARHLLAYRPDEAEIEALNELEQEIEMARLRARPRPRYAVGIDLASPDKAVVAQAHPTSRAAIAGDQSWQTEGVRWRDEPGDVDDGPRVLPVGGVIDTRGVAFVPPLAEDGSVVSKPVPWLEEAIGRGASFASKGPSPDFSRADIDYVAAIESEWGKAVERFDMPTVIKTPYRLDVVDFYRSAHLDCETDPCALCRDAAQEVRRLGSWDGPDDELDEEERGEPSPFSSTFD